MKTGAATTSPVLTSGKVAAKVATWPPDLRAEWEERAAIREYCGGQSRLEAELAAIEDVENMFHRTGEARPSETRQEKRS